MDDYVTEVEKNPSRISSALDMMRRDTVTPQCLIDLLPDSFNLAAAFPAADNEIVCEGADLPGIKYYDILSLLV